MRNTNSAKRSLLGKVKKHRKKVFILGFVILFLFGYSKLFVASKRIPQSTIIAKPLAQVKVGKTFEFPAQIVDNQNNVSKKKTKDKIEFTIVSAEIKDEIKVKGKPRPASHGRAYLLLRLELNNKTTNRLAFASTDHIRMVATEDNKEKLFSPDFHNGLVGIEPLSVKRDLTSFIVNRDQKDFTFLVGELEGEKEKIEIHF